jgi:hypothetical protein
MFSPEVLIPNDAMVSNSFCIPVPLASKFPVVLADTDVELAVATAGVTGF